MGWELPLYLQQADNAAVARFLSQRSPSAHSDVAEALYRSAEELAEVRFFCPDPSCYAYVVLFNEHNKIFGLAYGMNRLCYRIPDGHREEAKMDGGVPCADLGSDWVCFDPFDPAERTEESRQKMIKWCHVAVASL